MFQRIVAAAGFVVIPAHYRPNIPAHPFHRRVRIGSITDDVAQAQNLVILSARVLEDGVALGQTEAQARAVLGAPPGVSKMGGGDVWDYPNAVA